MPWSCQGCQSSCQLRGTCAPLGNCRKLLQRRPNTVQILFRLFRLPEWLFPMAFSFRFPHCLLFGAATVNSQLNYAISYECVCVSVCALHYFHFTFGAAYLLGLSLHVLYIFIKLAPAACIWTTLLAFPTYRWLERATPALGPGCCLLPGWFPCCLACHGRCLAYCTCLASVE